MARGTKSTLAPDAQFVARLTEVMADGKRRLILIYGNPDPDALASGWALKVLLDAADMPAEIAYTGEVGRLENEVMIRALRIPVSQLRPETLQQADRIALVDCQPGFFTDIALPRCDAVIDHHPAKSGGAPAPYGDIRPSCLATSSILTEYLVARRIHVSRSLATALLYGIMTDARNMQRPASATDRRAMIFLDLHVNRMLLRRIEFSSYSLNRLSYFNVALVNLRHANHILYTHIGPVPHGDVCAQIADFLIRVREANWAVVSGVTGRKLVIVFRCDGQRKNAGLSAQAAFGAIGSAGGHATMGRAEVNEDALPDRILLTQNERIERFVVGSLARAERSFGPLLRVILRHGT